MSGGIFFVGVMFGIVGFIGTAMLVGQHCDIGATAVMMMSGFLVIACIVLSLIFDSMEHLKLSMQYDDVRIFTFDATRQEEHMKEIAKFEANGWSCASSKEFQPFNKPPDITFRTVILVKDNSKKLRSIAEQFDALK